MAQFAPLVPLKTMHFAGMNTHLRAGRQAMCFVLAISLTLATVAVVLAFRQGI
jgi:hypothetical protein